MLSLPVVVSKLCADSMKTTNLSKKGYFEFWFTSDSEPFGIF